MTTLIGSTQNRSKVNKISVLSGRMAKADDEITIDRLFAENNDIKVGVCPAQRNIVEGLRTGGIFGLQCSF